MTWCRRGISVRMDSLLSGGLPSGSCDIHPSLSLFLLVHLFNPTPRTPHLCSCTKMNVSNQTACKTKYYPGDIMTNILNVESGKRTSVLLFGLGNERRADFRSRRGMSFLPRWTSHSLKPGGHGLLVFVMPEPVILKDIGFPENTQIYLWRIREGFPTQSEALG